MSDDHEIIYPLVENYLPKQFIYDIGLYLQTIAHIEFSICTLILEIFEYEEGCTEWVLNLHRLRKLPQKELLSELRKASKRLPEQPGQGLIELVEWMNTYKQNRHIAAHGAFYATERPGVLKVHYTHLSGDKENREYVAESAELTRGVVTCH